MKKMRPVLFLLFFLTLLTQTAAAQCSICTKSAQQLGDKAAGGLNTAIVYLAFTPLLIIAYIGYRWYRSEKGK
jgi:hypothetical protein